MLQRNDTGYPITSYDVGRVIGPGEEFEFPKHITGCTVLDEPAADPGAEPAEDSGPEPAEDDATPQQPAEDGATGADEDTSPPSEAPEGNPATTTGSEGEVA